MILYIVIHENPNFTGFCAGLDFDQGIASTNCREYAYEAAKAVNGKVKIKEIEESETEKKGK